MLFWSWQHPFKVKSTNFLALKPSNFQYMLYGNLAAKSERETLIWIQSKLLAWFNIKNFYSRRLTFYVEGCISNTQEPSSCGFVSLIECHIETHIEDSFPVSSGFESLIEIHIEDIVTSCFVSLFWVTSSVILRLTLRIVFQSHLVLRVTFRKSILNLFLIEKVTFCDKKFLTESYWKHTINLIMRVTQTWWIEAALCSRHWTYFHPLINW